MIVPMIRKPWLCIALFAGPLLCASAEDPVVAVTGGRVRGAATADGGVVFKGVPFARPPLGELRWREPQPLIGWDGVRDATQFKPACTQLSEGWNTSDVTGSGEDCLYLNIAAPEWPVKAKRPVLYWIHGGSNTAGSGEASAIEARALPRRGVVFVAVNYRLGALGFMAHPELSRESPHFSSGNYGLLDQIAGLRWVRDNIARFGGDPANVTVGGESAGAYDIGLLMTSPLAKGLFHRAIAESGAVTIFGGPVTAARAADKGRKIAAALKAPEVDAIRFLRAVPAEEILKAARGDRSGLEASVDGWVLPESPIRVFAEGRALAAPLLIGSNAQETGGPEPATATRGKIQKAYGDLAGKALGVYQLTGEGEGRPDPLYGPPGTQWSTDWEFRCPAVAEAVWHAAAGHLTYQYEFERPAPGRKASVHAGELVFLFGNWQPEAQPAPADRKISEQMQAYWANFARSGDPNGEGLPPWPKFTSPSRGYLAFTNEGAAAKSDLRRDACEIYLESLKQRR
jgi:para-nitrobenzyl esterase